MNYQFGDRSEESSRAQKIRALFTAGTTIQEHTEVCIRQDVWTQSELLGMASIQARAEVREALGQLTPEGVPFAGPTSQRRVVSEEEGAESEEEESEEEESEKPRAKRKISAPIWRQMEFWSKRDFDYNYTAYKRRERQNAKIAGNIARVCRERYGEDPIDLGDYPIEDEPQ